MEPTTNSIIRSYMQPQTNLGTASTTFPARASTLQQLLTRPCWVDLSANELRKTRESWPSTRPYRGRNQQVGFRPVHAAQYKIGTRQASNRVWFLAEERPNNPISYVRCCGRRPNTAGLVHDHLYGHRRLCTDLSSPPGRYTDSSPLSWHPQVRVSTNDSASNVYSRCSCFELGFMC